MTEKQLLDLLKRRAQTLAVPPPQDMAGQTIELLLVSVHHEQYAIPISWVRSIHRLSVITPVPRTPSFMLGIFNARGQLVPVTDLALFLQLSPTEHTPNSKIVIVGDEETEIESGLLVDDILDVIEIFKRDLNSPLPTQDDYRARFTQGITDDMIVILDLGTLLNDPQFTVREEL